MKKIAVIAPDFAVEHCIDFMEGVNQFFKNKDVLVYFTHAKFHKYSPESFDYQYWSSAELLKSKEIQGYIFISGVFCSIIPQKDYFKLIEEFNDRPVVSASISIPSVKNCYSVVTDARKSYFQIVEHMVKVHGCRRIAFLSANSTGSSEALERFDAYKAALDLYGVPFDENIVFDGQFNEHDIRNIFQDKFKKKEDVNFDAIISANDVMAVEAMKCLEEIGVKCPEDVKVFGFDDAVFASMSIPRLSTINQNVKNQGNECARLLYELVCGEKKEPVNYAELAPVVRQSCGCVPMHVHDFYKDFSGRIHSEKHSNTELLNLYMNETFEKKRYISLLDLMRSSNTLRQLSFNIIPIMFSMMVNEIRICLYKEHFFMNKTDDYSIPDEAELLIYGDVNEGKKLYHPDIFFNPHETVSGFDDKQVKEAKGTYIVYPIYSDNINYGYMLLKPRKDNFFSYTVNLKIVSSFIAQAVDYTTSLLQMQQLTAEKNQLLINNDTLALQNKTDELTQILNRRGFLELGQRTLDVMQEMAVAGIVFFGDIDGLKNINDNFGHKEGDRAIYLIAHVLKSAFRQSDVVGRLSGDEFGIVANGMTIDMVDKVRDKVDRLCKKATEENHLPYRLGISLGATDLEVSSILSSLLTAADKSLYEIKKIHHSGF